MFLLDSSPRGWMLAGLFSLGLASESLGAQTLTPLRGIAQVSAGGAHTCALTAGGGVKCWGANSAGQLGDGTTTHRLLPVDVVGLSSGVAAVSASESYTCALTTAGAVKCWGLNYYGQLGNGSGAWGATERLPVDVVGLNSGVAAISAGSGHACALTTEGDVWCWGRNHDGQLGDGGTTQQPVPVAVTGLSDGVAAIRAGGGGAGGHTCALTLGGGIQCWGSNQHGQLGDGSTVPRLQPVAVIDLPGTMASVELADYHSCGLTTGGAVYCWGSNGWARLGHQGFGEPHSPIPLSVTGLGAGVSAIALQGYLSCARMMDARVRCWGVFHWPVGSVFPVFTTNPVDQGLGSAVAISVGEGATTSHRCALMTNGGVKCWGSNTYGQLGNGNTGGYHDTAVEVMVTDALFGNGFEG